MLLPNKESGAHWMNSNKNFFSPNKSPKVTFRSKSDFFKNVRECHPTNVMIMSERNVSERITEFLEV